MAVGLLAHWHVRRTYARHSRTPTLGGYTGAEAAHEILRQAGITRVEVVEHEELLGDHYDPRHHRLVLSSANYHGTSPAALGVAVAQVLNAAAWTYVAAFVTSLIYFLWHLLPLLTGRDRE
jgi:uncharacterized protein